MRVGPYAIESLLGQGGMGTVYRARGPRGQEVALKVLSPSASGRNRQRFRQELRTVSSLRHPHLVEIYDAGEDNGQLFLAMRLVEGETLQARIDADGFLPIPAALQIARALSSALRYAHLEGVLHRDVKPDNVLLGHNDEVRLTDFGLARELDSDEGNRLSLSGAAMGTPGYWAPEQALGQLMAIGPPTDVYGLGATLYAALTGRPPQQATSLGQAIEQASLAPPPPSRFRSDIPRWLERVCLRCLDPDPARRYASGSELNQALAQGQTRSPWVARVAIAAIVATALLALALSLAPSRGSALAEGPTSIRALIDAEDYEGARRQANALLAADPKSAELTLLRGEAYFELRLDDESERDLRRALKLDPAQLRGEALLGELLADSDRFEEAEPLLRRSLERPPVRAETYAALARVTLLTNRHDETLSLVEQALKAGPRSRAPALRARGQVYAAQKRYPEALATFELALQDDPDNPGIHFERAATLHQLGRPQEAAAEYDVVVTLAPELLLAREQRAKCRQDCGDLEGAIADARFLAEQRTGSLEYARSHARYLELAGYSEEARRELERAAKLDPGDLWTQALLGVTHGKLGDYATAKRILSRVLERDPNHTNALLNRASAFRTLGDLPRARVDLERLLQLDPEHVDGLVSLGAVLLAQNQQPRALEAFERASALAPHDPDVLAELGSAVLSTRGPAAALAVYERGLRAHPDDPKLLVGRSGVLGRLRRYAEALASSQRALELHPNDHEALITAGLALNGLERYAESEPLFRRSVELAPQQDTAWSGLGRALRNLARPRDALPALTRALDLNPRSRFALAQRALTHRALGDEKAALADWDRIAVDNPTSEPLLLERATTLLGLGELERADDDLQRLFALKPNHLLGQGLRVKLLLMRGEEVEALSLARTLLAEKPDLREALQFGALAALNLEEYEQAVTWCERLSERFPRYLPPRAIRATALSALGRLDESLALINETLEFSPESVNLIWLRAQVHVKQGNVEEGLADCRVAQATDPHDPHCVLTEGEIHADLGDFEAARACVERARPLVISEPQARRLEQLEATLAQEEE